MQNQGVERPWPGPQEARGLQAALVIAGFLGLVIGAYGSAPMFIWLSILHKPHNPVPFPVVSLLALLAPVVPIALGAWAWRGRRSRKLTSIYAIAAGGLGLGIGIVLGVVILAISFVA